MAPGIDRLLRWAVAALAIGVGVHGIDHMFLRGMEASPASIIIGGNVQAAAVGVAVIMVWMHRRRAPEAAVVAGFGSAVVFIYAHLLPAVWHDYSDSFVSPPHTNVTWYSWVTAVAEIGTGLVAAMAGIRARQARPSGEHERARV